MNNDYGKPLDPTTDAEELFTDPSGRTGITASKNSAVTRDDIFEADADAENMSTVLAYDDPRVQMKNVKRGPAIPDESDRSQEDSASYDIPSEQWMSGDMPDPESDDNMLDASHRVGLRLEEDEENPQPMDIAADVAVAEKAHRDM